MANNQPNIQLYNVATQYSSQSLLLLLSPIIILKKFLIIITTINIFIQIFHINYYIVLASLIGECNFEKYSSGCFSQANFICDRETNLCKCHPDSPILIEERLCLKRAKENEICQFSEQCDNSKGIYCLNSDLKLVNNSQIYLRDNLKHSYPRCRNINKLARSKHKSLSNQFNIASSHLLSSQHNSHHYNYNDHNNNSAHNNSHTSTHSSNSYLPRIVWLFLLACLICLIILLLLIKFQYHKVGRSFQEQVEDRLSINSELDIPPPYEIAIRMKL